MSALEAIFSWVLTATWQASVLALLVLFAQATLGRRLNPRWRYALWLLVVLRLLLPSLPESPLSLFRFTLPPPAALTVSVSDPLFASPPPQVPSSFSPAEISTPGHPLSIYSLLAILWLAGALGLSIPTWLVNLRFSRQVTNSPEITDPEIRQSFANAKSELGIRRRIRLIENSHVQSPAIMGLFQPTLLLPANVREKFDARELRFIFLHELAHLKRGDVLVQALIALLQIIHWFNPVLWYAFRRIRIDREPATDALVLSRTGEAEKEHYGLMLIKLLDHFNQRHSLPTLVGILEDRDQFKRRFALIARFTRGAYAWSLLGVVLITLLAALCLTRSQAETSTPPIGSVESKKFVHFSLQVIQLGEEDYRPHQASIDAAVERGDASFFSQFKSFNLVSKLGVLIKPGERGVLESVRVLPYPAAFGTDTTGKTAPTEFQRRSLGTRMYLWPQVDRGKITLDGALQVTSLNCWVEAKKGQPEPAFNVMGATVRAEIFAQDETKGFSFTGGAHEQPLDPSQAFGPDKNIASLPHQFGRMFYFITASEGDFTSSAAVTATAPPKYRQVTVKGQMKLAHAARVDWAKTTGYFQSVDGDYLEFYFQPDGSFTIPAVKPGVYNWHVHPFSADPLAEIGGDVMVNSSPLTVEGTAAQMTANGTINVEVLRPPKDSIRIELKLIEVDDVQYQANKQRMDAAVERGDSAYFNTLEHVSLLSTPSVTTTPGMKANIDIVREFPYPSDFENGKISPHQTLSVQGGGMTNVTLIVPPTPREFVTKDVGVTAEITPRINPADSPAPGKIVLLGAVSVVDFEGFTQSNVDSAVKMPSFITRESHFLEQVGDSEQKGLWLPGLHASEPPPTDKSSPSYASSASRAAVKRLLLFVSATRAP